MFSARFFLFTLVKECFALTINDVVSQCQIESLDEKMLSKSYTSEEEIYESFLTIIRTHGSIGACNGPACSSCIRVQPGVKNFSNMTFANNTDYPNLADQIQIVHVSGTTLVRDLSAFMQYIDYTKITSSMWFKCFGTKKFELPDNTVHSHPYARLFRYCTDNPDLNFPSQFQATRIFTAETIYCYCGNVLMNGQIQTRGPISKIISCANDFLGASGKNLDYRQVYYDNGIQPYALPMQEFVLGSCLLQMGIAVDHHILVRQHSVASLITANSTHLTKPETNSQRKAHYPAGDVARIFESFNKDISYALLNTSSFGMSGCSYGWNDVHKDQAGNFKSPMWADVQFALNNDSVANKMTGGYDVRNYAHFGPIEEERTMIPNSLIKPKSLMCETCRRANINLKGTPYAQPAASPDFEDVKADEMFVVPAKVSADLKTLLKDGQPNKIELCRKGVNVGMHGEVPSLDDKNKIPLEAVWDPSKRVFCRPYAAFVVAQTILADQIKMLENEKDAIKKAQNGALLFKNRTAFEIIGKEVTGYTDIDLAKCNCTTMEECPIKLIVDATEVALDDYSSEMDKIKRELGTDRNIIDICAASANRRSSQECLSAVRVPTAKASYHPHGCSVFTTRRVTVTVR